MKRFITLLICILLPLSCVCAEYSFRESEQDLPDLISLLKTLGLSFLIIIVAEFINSRLEDVENTGCLTTTVQVLMVLLMILGGAGILYSFFCLFLHFIVFPLFYIARFIYLIILANGVVLLIASSPFFLAKYIINKIAHEVKRNKKLILSAIICISVDAYLYTLIPQETVDKFPFIPEWNMYEEMYQNLFPEEDEYEYEDEY